MDDIASANDQAAPVPSRFLPALIAELAAELAVKKVGDPSKRAELQQRAREFWVEAERGDASRASIQIMPELHW